MNDRITIGRDGAFGAYISRPKTSPASAVVVLQELFGVNADIRTGNLKFTRPYQTVTSSLRVKSTFPPFHGRQN
jgi:hypothetical protein